RAAVVEHVARTAGSGTLLLFLRGIRKPLVINYHTVDVLAPVLGRDTADWAGKRVRLRSDCSGVRHEIRVTAEVERQREELTPLVPFVRIGRASAGKSRS